jgi:hypothetical protein
MDRFFAHLPIDRRVMLGIVYDAEAASSSVLLRVLDGVRS